MTSLIQQHPWKHARKEARKECPVHGCHTIVRASKLMCGEHWSRLDGHVTCSIKALDKKSPTRRALIKFVLDELGKGADCVVAE